MASHHTSPLAPTNRTNMVGSSGLATVLLVVMAMLANCERAPWQPGIAQGKPEGGNGFRSAGRFAAHAGLGLSKFLDNMVCTYETAENGLIRDNCIKIAIPMKFDTIEDTVVKEGLAT